MNQFKRTGLGASAVLAALAGFMPAMAAVTTAQAAAPAASSGPEYFARPSNGGPPLPFSESVQVGDLLFISGTIGVVPGTVNLVPGGIGPEAHRVMDTIKDVVERRGGSLDQLVKCTVFLADIKEWPAFNEVYRDYFKKSFPARSAFATNGLVNNARVEVECIAYISQKPVGPQKPAGR